MTYMKVVSAWLIACGMAAAQPAGAPVRMASDGQPVYRTTVTARTAKAINYQHRSGATKIDFRGPALLPKSSGEAKVEGKQGYIEIEVEFDELEAANKFGAEYLTYVLWAISPEGRTSNLGEVILNGNRSKLNVSTDLQVFGLVVTAEPYFSVTRPSDLVVMENVVRADTRGKVEEIDAKYELLQRGQYTRLANPLALKLDKSVPLELYQARNAVQIAKSIGAEKFANETFVKAEKSLAAAEAYQARKAGKKPVTMTARETVQTAEDARAIAVKRQEEEALSTERRQSVEREATAESGRAAALAETERVTRAKEAQAAAATAEAERVRRDNDTRAAAAALEADRLKRENEANASAAAMEANRLKAQNEAQADAAKNAADRAKLENDTRAAAAAAEADRLKRENEAQQAASQSALDGAAKQRARLEADKVALRTQLLQQFNAVLQTRDTARGLIVNMSDVLFDTAKSSLRPAAREKLARVAGIVAGHPGLKLDVEGHTDSVGSDEYNQKLSEQRATSVRDYLTQGGMAQDAVTMKGMGEGTPVATNDTNAGRQQNRRVEIVISGEVIGSAIGMVAAK
jgi:outer membrane protein OmpA-like peptidoglycan-associated protein